MKKNTVSVKAPVAAAFWASNLSNSGVAVVDGQVISAKSGKINETFVNQEFAYGENTLHL